VAAIRTAGRGAAPPGRGLPPEGASASWARASRAIGAGRVGTSRVGTTDFHAEALGQSSARVPRLLRPPGAIPSMNALPFS
jgi:hypothetical protein